MSIFSPNDNRPKYSRFIHNNFCVSNAAKLKDELDKRLAREKRTALAQACFDFLPARAMLDLAGWAEQDIFAHV